jgi:hypothetical protein
MLREYLCKLNTNEISMKKCHLFYVLNDIMSISGELVTGFSGKKATKVACGLKGEAIGDVC